MRGTISAIAPDGTYGQISSEDGQRYSYWTSEVRNGLATVGQKVDFQMWEGQPVEIFLATTPRPPSAPPPRSGPQPQMTASAGAMSQFAGRGQGPAGRQPYAAAGPAAYAQAMSSAAPSGSGYWIKLFTSPSGRISRRQFWLHGVLPIVIGSVLLGWIPVIGQILTLVLLWGNICIGFKRFHDLGYPGWYSLVYLVPMLAAGVIFGLGFVVTSFIDLAWLLAEILWGVAILIGLAQLIFVYIRIGQEGPNQYGPDPLAN